MKRLTAFLLFISVMFSLSACSTEPEILTPTDAWQVLYDYLVEQGPIEKEDQGIRTFHLESKAPNNISISLSTDLSSGFSSGGGSLSVLIPHDKEVENCPVQLSLSYNYMGFGATEFGEGSINRTTYQTGASFSWTTHEITEGIESSFTDDISSQVVSDLIAFLCDTLNAAELNINMEDLGFLAYETPSENES